MQEELLFCLWHLGGRIVTKVMSFFTWQNSRCCYNGAFLKAIEMEGSHFIFTNFSRRFLTEQGSSIFHLTVRKSLLVKPAVLARCGKGFPVTEPFTCNIYHDFIKHLKAYCGRILEKHINTNELPKSREHFWDILETFCCKRNERSRLNHLNKRLDKGCVTLPLQFAHCP